MSHTIWKSELEVTDRQQIEVPEGAEFLYVAAQNNKPCVWFRCDPNKAKVTVPVAMAGTGHPAPGKGDARYLGSVMLNGGMHVFHIFIPLNF